MSIMYKYVNFSLLNSFIEHPTFKLTNPEELNDPFECRVCEEIKNTYNEITKKRILEPVRIKIIESAISGMGIVSLTETHRNKLMWAHYADEHKGVVIGFDTKLLSEYISTNNTSNTGALIEPKLYKVNYDSVRFDIKSPENSFLNDRDPDEIIKILMERIITTKSDDWIYEKEHRYILPPGYCDRIKIKVKSDNQKKYAIQNIINNICECEGDEIISEENYDTDGYLERVFEIKSNLTFIGKHINVKELKYLCQVSKLMSIPKGCISSIHFGERVGWGQKLIITNKINKHSQYDKVKLFEVKLCKNTFDLKSELIDKYNYCPSAQEIDEIFQPTNPPI